jgi:hypothetical protein
MSSFGNRDESKGRMPSRMGSLGRELFAAVIGVCPSTLATVPIAGPKE